MLSGFTIGWIPARNSNKAKPMFAASAITECVPQPSLYISAEVDPNAPLFEVKRGWIAITRSGTVGNVGLIYNNLDGKYLSNDALRILPKNPLDRGVLYTYLRSEQGRSLLQNLTYGSVVGHIKTFQVEALPIPVVTDKIRNHLALLTDKVIAAREQAMTLLDDAKTTMEKSTHLPSLLEDAMESNPEGGTAVVFKLPSTEAQVRNGDGSDYRLDAHFYNPTAQLAVANIKKCPCEVKTVGEVAREIRMSPLFVRKYVAKEHGVPYIAGKQISQIRPEFKYISRTATEDLDQHILHEGWILVTCAGSVGKVGYVSGSLIGAAAQDIMRVIPDETKVDGGYLNAWLASEYGRVLVERCRYGSVVDRVSPQHIGSVLIPLASSKEQRAIGDMVREAYEKRAEAIRLEDEAQAILMKELTKGPGTKGV
jgi:type I restriction enzyme S subunit